MNETAEDQRSLDGRRALAELRHRVENGLGKSLRLRLADVGALVSCLDFLAPPRMDEVFRSVLGIPVFAV
jgi:hypothetical protein